MDFGGIAGSNGKIQSSAMAKLQILVTALLAASSSALVPKDGKTGKLPALGFNSWNVCYPQRHFKCPMADNDRRSAAISTKTSSWSPLKRWLTWVSKMPDMR
jgi:hypothetical protein